MTEVAFHLNVGDRTVYLCRLLRKASCSGPTCAMEGMCCLGTIRKCTGAQGFTSWKARISSSS